MAPSSASSAQTEAEKKAEKDRIRHLAETFDGGRRE